MLGAAGGVGSAAVELGKAMGARVIAAASSAEKVEAAKSWGADAGVVYPRGPFDRDGQKKLAEIFKSACGEKGADVIYDSGRRRLFRGGAARDRLGRPLSRDRLSRRHPQTAAQSDAAEILSGRRRVLGRLRRRAIPRRNARNALELFALYEKGLIKPRISKRFPLREAGAAIAWLAEPARARQGRGDGALMQRCLAFPRSASPKRHARLTAPGSPFEIEEIEIRGRDMRVWKTRAADAARGVPGGARASAKDLPRLQRRTRELRELLRAPRSRSPQNCNGSACERATASPSPCATCRNGRSPSSARSSSAPSRRRSTPGEPGRSSNTA